MEGLPKASLINRLADKLRGIATAVAEQAHEVHPTAAKDLQSWEAAEGPSDQVELPGFALPLANPALLLSRRRCLKHTVQWDSNGHNARTRYKREKTHKEKPTLSPHYTAEIEDFAVVRDDRTEVAVMQSSWVEHLPVTTLQDPSAAVCTLPPKLPRVEVAAERGVARNHHVAIRPASFGKVIASHLGSTRVHKATPHAHVCKRSKPKRKKRRACRLPQR